MRWLVLALTAMSASPAMAQQSDLKPFDFMGYVAGEVIPPARLKGCQGKGPDVACYNSLVKLADVYAGYRITTHNYKLSTVLIDAHPNSYDRLMAAFTAKYGPPCETARTVWKNAVGAELENPVSSWCFTTGKLTFSKFGARLDQSGILYQDINKAATPEPVVNF